MTSIQSKGSHGRHKNKSDHKRGWGGRLNPRDVRSELSGGNPSQHEPIISAEEEHSLLERLALLHQQCFQTKELLPVNLKKLGFNSTRDLQTAFLIYDIAVSKNGRRFTSATTGPLSVLLGTRNKKS